MCNLGARYAFWGAGSKNWKNHGQTDLGYKGVNRWGERRAERSATARREERYVVDWRRGSLSAKEDNY